MALIDKDQIRAEIERLEGENNCGTSDFIESKRIAYKQVKEALDSIPEQPISEDLEEEIASWIPNQIKGKKDSDFRNAVVKWAGFVARHFAEWQKAKMMEEGYDAFVSADKTIPVLPMKDVSGLGLNYGDKVRVIVIKEDTK